jgi:hypothetical protein
MSTHKTRMMVQLSDEGLRQLGSALLSFAKTNSVGQYFLCEAVDPNGPYFYMLVDMGTTDQADGPNLELSVPHAYIRFYMRAENEKQIGFLK